MKQQINITSKESQLAGGKPVGHLKSVEELSSELPKTNPSSGRKEDLNPGPPHCKSSALPLGHARLAYGIVISMLRHNVVYSK